MAISQLNTRTLKGSALEHAELDANFARTHPVLSALLSGYEANRSNARTRGVMSSPPTITVGTATTPSGHTRTYVFGAAGHPFSSGGGLPTTVSGSTTFPCRTASGATFTGNYWRVECLVDGDEVGFLLSGDTTAGYRFIVDGQYASLSGTTAADTTNRYHVLTFSSSAQRVVVVEGSGNTAFLQATCKASASIFPTLQSNRIRMIVMGDSNIESFGLNLKGSGVAANLADHLGIMDVWSSGVSDTGFVANNGGALNNYAARRTDWSTRSPHALLFTCSINEIVQGTSTSAHANAVTAEIAQVRSLLGKYLPVIITGIVASKDYLSANSILTLAQSHESAVESAINALNDPFVRFLPQMNSPYSSVITGSGTGTGNWNQYVIGGGNTHANANGYVLVTKRLLSSAIEAWADMLTVPVPR